MSTSLASRGVDVPDVSLVVNYEVPMEQDDYIHRIGRTGRGGRKGVAVTLFSPEEQERAPGVERVLMGSGQEVPAWLKVMCASHPSSISLSRPRTDHDDDGDGDAEEENVGGMRERQPLPRRPRSERLRRQGQEGVVGPSFSSWRRQPVGVFLRRGGGGGDSSSISNQGIDQEEVKANATALLERWNQIISGRTKPT